MIGRSIGPYTIVEKIGQGGMGEVYRATDSRLKRDVALKFLPKSMAQEETARRRFLLEARAAAALVHPYICQIHEVGEDDDGCSFIAMEYVSGQTLKDRLIAGSIPVLECLQIAAEIAEALDKAQQRGIVHRDLKPANIMISSDGHVKVMDFGLAKRLEVGLDDGHDLTQEQLTGHGTIVGTIPYMSPEQLKGEAVDSRSDIFCFGIILYEMLAGVHPFLKTNAMSTAGSILQQEPASLETHGLRVSPVIQHMVAKMLDKEPDRRYQLVKEIHEDLIALLKDSPPGALLSDVSAARKSAVWNSTIWLLLPLLLLAVFVTWKFWPDLSRSPGPGSTAVSLRSEISFPPGERFVSGFSHGITVSPDGQLLAFTSGTMEPEDLDGSSALYPETSQLYLRRLGQNTSYPLPGTEGARYPVFSPDSQWIAFAVYPGGPGSRSPRIRKVPVAGGDAVDLCACGGVGRMTWGPQGIVVPGFDWIEIINPVGGDTQRHKIKLEPWEYYPRWPSFLPDGKTLLLTILRYRNYQSLHDWSAARVYAYSLETKERTLLLEGASDARYVSTGHLLFARHYRPLWRFDDKAVWAVPFDPSTLTIKGPEVAVLTGVNRSVDTGDGRWERGESQYAVSDQGLLAYIPGGPFPLPRREVAWVDREGREEKIPIAPGPYTWARVSADGKSFILSTRNFPSTIHLYEGPGFRERDQMFFAPLAPGAPRQSEAFAVWGPGPDRITFLLDSYDPDNRRPTEVWTSPIYDSGKASRLSTTKEIEVGERRFPFRPAPVEWSADGKLAALSGYLWSFNAQGELSPISTSQSAQIGGCPSFSPDGRWVATDLLRRNSRVVDVRIFSTTLEGAAVQAVEGADPVWSRDGKELFFVRREPAASAEDPKLEHSALYSVAIRETREGLVLGDPEKLFQGPYLVGFDNDNVRAYDVGPDGRFLMIKELDRAQKQKIIEEFYPSKIQLVQNWFSELTQMVPSGQ